MTIIISSVARNSYDYVNLKGKKNGAFIFINFTITDYNHNLITVLYT